jgi:hypothetical protein
MATLLEITDDLKALDELLAECGGDITDTAIAATVDSWFARLDSDFNGKVDNYSALITEIRHRAETRKAESERLARRAKSDENAADWLSSRLREALEQRGIKKVDTDRYTVSVVGNGGKQPLLLDAEIPGEWTKTKMVVEPDKERIRSCLEAGESLPFASLGERGKRLSIR